MERSITVPADPTVVWEGDRVTTEGEPCYRVRVVLIPLSGDLPYEIVVEESDGKDALGRPSWTLATSRVVDVLAEAIVDILRPQGSSQ